MKDQIYDVAIIGAGPSGATAAAMLADAGKKVLVIERQQFPRFSIGESLLPQCMAYLQQAGLESLVTENADELGFQFKNGAAFYCQGKHVNFDFRKKFSDGPGTTFQVKRERFDQLLIQGAADKGAQVEHGVTLTDIDFSSPDFVSLSVATEHESFEIKAAYVLDASGFGRVIVVGVSVRLSGSASSILPCKIRLGGW